MKKMFEAGLCVIIVYYGTMAVFNLAAKGAIAGINGAIKVADKIKNRKKTTTTDKKIKKDSAIETYFVD